MAEAFTSAGELVPDLISETGQDTTPTIMEASLLVPKAAKALHFDLELLSQLVHELGGDWSATTVSELTTIPSSDVETSIRGLLTSTECRNDRCNEAPTSAGCTSTHTDTCVIAALRGGTGQENWAKRHTRRPGCLQGRSTPRNSRHWTGSRLGDGAVRLELHRIFVFRWTGLRPFERWIP